MNSFFCDLHVSYILDGQCFPMKIHHSGGLSKKILLYTLHCQWSHAQLPPVQGANTVQQFRDEPHGELLREMFLLDFLPLQKI